MTRQCVVHDIFSDTLSVSAQEELNRASMAVLEVAREYSHAAARHLYFRRAQLQLLLRQLNFCASELSGAWPPPPALPRISLLPSTATHHCRSSSLRTTLQLTQVNRRRSMRTLAAATTSMIVESCCSAHASRFQAIALQGTWPSRSG